MTDVVVAVVVVVVPAHSSSSSSSSPVENALLRVVAFHAIDLTNLVSVLGLQSSVVAIVVRSRRLLAPSQYCVVVMMMVVVVVVHDYSDDYSRSEVVWIVPWKQH